MQSAFTLPADHFDQVLGWLAPGLDLDALALHTKAIERKRVLTGGADLLRLSLARGPGGLSLSQTAAWATLLGFPPMSDPGVKYKLDKAVGFLDGVLAHQLAAAAPGAAVHWPGRSLRACDCTCVRERGSAIAGWQVHGLYDLERGGFADLRLTNKRGAEAMDCAAPVAGEVRIADHGFARLPGLLGFRQASAGEADFIVRIGWNAFSLRHADGTKFDLIMHLSTLPCDMHPHDVLVFARAGRCREPQALRLVIQRETAQAAEVAGQQKVVKPGSPAAAEYIVLVTSLPMDGYTAADILAVYRLRWQIEIAFKRLKSLLHINTIPTRTDAASRSWLTAHLILALLCDRMNQDVPERSPSGPARRRGLAVLQPRPPCFPGRHRRPDNHRLTDEHRQNRPPTPRP